jgi:transposase-like protein
MTTTCPHCGKEIEPRPVGRPPGSRMTSQSVASAVAAVQSGTMTVSEAASRYGVSRQAIHAARKRLTPE